MSEQILNINGVEICAESFGDPADPPVLLLMGAMASMIWWDEEFCRRLAERARFVIRFDNRDVGRSTAYEAGTINYTVEDLTDDAVGVLAAYGLEKAHFVGMSLGGMLAQIAALRYPSRVLTITLIASGLFGPDDPDLPPIDEKILAYHARAKTVDWSDTNDIADYLVGGGRLLNGSKREFDEERAVQLAETEIRRARNLLSMFNHAQLGGGEQYSGKAREIKVPALIIHGTEDTVLAYGHALALAREIPETTLLTLEGAGHEIHRDDWDAIIDAIIEHTN